MSKKMKNKIAIITGSSKGIGKDIADAFLKKGYIVIGCATSFKNEEKNNYLTLKCDVTKEEEIKKIVKTIVKKYGRIDVLINNAGVMFYDDITDIKEEDLDKMYNVNVKGVLFFSKAVIPIMRKQKNGYIINMSSIRGVTGAPNKGAYAATKFAVRGLTQTIHKENEKYGIKATAICPGLIYTESTLERMKIYGLSKKDLVQKQDIIKTIFFLLDLSSKAIIREIIIGGVL
jgi:NADP-dependent 3-hydroxy acid dehydrogenase YdfG